MSQNSITDNIDLLSKEEEEEEEELLSNITKLLNNNMLLNKSESKHNTKHNTSINNKNSKIDKKSLNNIFKTITEINTDTNKLSEEDIITKLYLLKQNQSLNLKKSLIEKNIFSTLFSFIDNPYPLQNNNIELKKSQLHGLGVFATENIEPNTIVTFYPAHAIINNNSVYLHNNINFEYANDYKLYFKNNITISANPNIIDNTLLIGHLLNDSVCISKEIEYIEHLEQLDQTEQIKKVKYDICKYLINSNNNCQFVKNDYGFCYVKTIKFVKKGDELLLSYGPLYWLTKQRRELYDKLSESDIKFNKFVTNSIIKNRLF